VGILLAYGANVDAKDDISQSTALHIACEAGRENVVCRLLHAGANLESTDNMGNTPLHKACHSGSVTRILLEEAAAKTLVTRALKTRREVDLKTALPWLW
jgi:ankyrin repeat protein